MSTIQLINFLMDTNTIVMDKYLVCAFMPVTNALLLEIAYKLLQLFIDIGKHFAWLKNPRSWDGSQKNLNKFPLESVLFR